MELRELAERVLLSPDLKQKVTPVREALTDREPGPARRVERPARPDTLQFADRRTAPAMPHPNTFGELRRRAIAHHIMANHELQALEVMAWVLLAFPEAPATFRAELAVVLQDEQRHTRMHAHRAAALGLTFGSLPVNSYLWEKSQRYESLLDYLAGLPLTFETRNLDHSLELAGHFDAVGDQRSATLMRLIHHDEISHVAFAWRWFNTLRPSGPSAWEAYQQHLHWPVRAEKSVGDVYLRQPRREAGLTDEFLDQLEQAAGLVGR